MSSTGGQEQLVQMSWICGCDLDKGTPVLSAELAFTLDSEKRKTSISSKGMARSRREGADPRLLCNLAITLTIWGSALKHEDGWDTSDLCGDSGRVAEFQEQWWQTDLLSRTLKPHPKWAWCIYWTACHLSHLCHLNWPRQWNIVNSLLKWELQTLFKFKTFYFTFLCICDWVS